MSDNPQNLRQRAVVQMAASAATQAQQESVGWRGSYRDVVDPAGATHQSRVMSATVARAQQAVQMRQANRAAPARDPDSVKQTATAGLQGNASSLPHLDRIQQSFGHHDVSHVAAHVGGQAAEASAAMGAEAYASGQEVAFSAPPDLWTAAHEAAHTVQQSHGVSLPGGVSRVGDPYEQHANSVADHVVAGRSAESLLSSRGGGQSADTTAVSHGDGAVQRVESGEEAIHVCADLGSRAWSHVTNIWDHRKTGCNEVETMLQTNYSDEVVQKNAVLGALRLGLTEAEKRIADTIAAGIGGGAGTIIKTVLGDLLDRFLDTYVHDTVSQLPNEAIEVPTFISTIRQAMTNQQNEDQEPFQRGVDRLPPLEQQAVVDAMRTLASASAVWSQAGRNTTLDLWMAARREESATSFAAAVPGMPLEVARLLATNGEVHLEIPGLQAPDSGQTAWLVHVNGWNVSGFEGRPETNAAIQGWFGQRYLGDINGFVRITVRDSVAVPGGDIRYHPFTGQLLVPPAIQGALEPWGGFQGFFAALSSVTLAQLNQADIMVRRP